MRKFYFLFTISLISSLSFGQTILFHEHFELPSGADSITSSGNPGWTINNTLAFEGTQSYHTGIAAQDTSYAQTIMFNTTGNNFVLFSFAHIAKLSFFDAGILEISTNNTTWTKITSTNSTYLGSGNFNAGTGDKFTAITYPQWNPAADSLIPDNTWWRVETFDISNLAANLPQVWLRFKAYDGNNNGSAGNYGWLIDSIGVVGYVCDPALTSGIASASHDSICNLTPVTLSLAGSHGNIQWLSSIDGGQTWQQETGQGSNTDEYIVNPSQTIQYAVVTSLGSCVSDTSNVVVIHVEQVVAPTTTGGSRCGIGNITLSASGNGTLNWYDSQTGGNLLNTGTTFTTYITGTTTYYVASLVGSAPVQDSLNVHPFVGGNGCGGGNMFEVNPVVDLTVEKLYLNLSAAAGSNVIVNLYFKSGTYLGSETNSGDWTLFETVNVTAAGANNPSPMIFTTGLSLTGGQNYAFYVNADVNYTNVPTPATYSNSDLSVVTGTGLCSAFGGLNPGRAWNGRIVYTKGSGCESPRTPVTATMNSADAVTISAASTALCEGESTTLNASSINSGYSYSWSPSTGLNTTTGPSVIATPLAPTWYYAIGDDGNCANIDSVFIDVGPAAIAGTASAPGDTVCTGNMTTLSLSGQQGNIQWYSSSDGINWQPETGAGSTSSIYSVTPMTDTYYIAVLSSAGCPNDTTNVLFIISLSPVAPTVTDATRCGYGDITLGASGVGTLNWYNQPTGGNFLNAGTTYTTTLNSTTTFYVEAVVGNSGGSNSGVLITEVDLGGTDALEIMNISGGPVDVTGWTVAISDSYTDINLVNTTVKTLSGIMNSGDILYWTDGTINPWGSNMFWNPGSFPTFTGWAIILDNVGNIVDFVVWAWPNSNIQTMNTTIAGFPITIGTKWNGDGINAAAATAGLSLSRQGNSDNDDSSDFTVQTSTVGSINNGLNVPFAGGGCSSPRVPVTATVTAPPPMTINASATSICQNDTSTVTVTSPNSGYNYTWSPSNGLNTTTGDSVLAFPSVTTSYILIADDGTCGNIDTLEIIVSPMTVAGTASGPDTVCSGVSAILTLTGYTGSIQWQSFDGTNWVNETNSGFDSSLYQVTPLVTTIYQALVQNGACPAIASNPVTIVSITPTNPTTIGDVRCGPGIVNLSAVGTGNFYWYEDSLGGNYINFGTSYSPNLIQTDTFYVENIIGGDFYNIGPLNNGFGNQTSANQNYGLTFNVTAQATLDRVHVYPWSTGTITINLRLGTGPVLASTTANVTAFTGKTPIDLGFPLSPATGYRLELISNGVSLGRNSTGATYPYSVPGGPLTITGYFNPNPGSLATDYRYFYDWLVSTGCKSQRIPVVGEILETPAVPTVTQIGNMLVSSSPINNQWYFNGTLIPGATSQNFAPDTSGLYYVVVDNNGCFETSNTIFFVHVGVEEIEYINLNVYPNPASGIFTLEFVNLEGTNTEIAIYNVTGAVIYKEEIEKLSGFYNKQINLSDQSNGLYFLMIRCGENKYFQKLMIAK